MRLSAKPQSEFYDAFKVHMIDGVFLDGKLKDHVTEFDTDSNWLIRLATDEYGNFILEPDQFNNGKKVLEIKEFGKVSFTLKN